MPPQGHPCVPNGRGRVSFITTERIHTYHLFKCLLLLSRFSRVQHCATPWTAAYQASLSMGFSKQEHWSGLPFPCPMHESGKWKWSCSVVPWLLATPWTAAYQAPPSMGFSRQQYWSGVPLPSPHDWGVRPPQLTTSS